MSVDDAVRDNGDRAIDKIVLQTRTEAESVIFGLKDMLSKYNIATVADLYDLIGLNSTFQDNKIGWTTLDGTTIKRTRSGYTLNLPTPKPI